MDVEMPRKSQTSKSGATNVPMWACAIALVVGVGAGFGVGWASNDTKEPVCVTKEEIESAQNAWAGAVVGIGEAWNSNGCTGAVAAANGALDAAYSFRDPSLLFKPTLTVAPNTFRPTRAGALSYFVGACAGSDHIPTDGGFTLGYSVGDRDNQTTWQGFTKVIFHDMTFRTGGKYCEAPIAQGKMTYTSRFTGLDYTVDKTFAYKKNPVEGSIPLITLHHSSKEVQPAVPCISVADIEFMQKAWGDAVVGIGDAWNANGCTGALAAAKGALDAAYISGTPYLFKPTLTKVPNTFRPTRVGALSYFVGACAHPSKDLTGESTAATLADWISTDGGFALGYSVGDRDNQSTWQGFTSVVFHDMRYHTQENYCNAALAQGKMTYTSRFTGQNYTVDKSFAYTRIPSEANPTTGLSKPLIVLHHSSLEYTA